MEKRPSPHVELDGQATALLTSRPIPLRTSRLSFVKTPALTVLYPGYRDQFRILRHVPWEEFWKSARAHSADVHARWSLSCPRWSRGLSVCLSACLSLSVYLYICIFVYLYICLFVYLYICLFVYLYVCIFVYLYVCIFVCLYVCSVVFCTNAGTNG